MKRPPRESYLRVSVEANGYTLEPALEWRWGDSFRDLSLRLTMLAERTANSVGTERVAPPDMAEFVGGVIADAWPDRAYFVEAWSDDFPGFGQTFQPWGVPRNDE